MPTSNSSSRRRWAQALVICGLLLGLLGGTRSAVAAEENRDFQEHYQRAMTLYKLGLLRQAAKEFVVAYALNPLPRLLYNLGQLLRRIGEYKEAAEAYELYLRTEAELSPERKAEVERYLTALRVETQASNRPPVLVADAARQSSGPAEDTNLLTLPPAPEAKAGRFMFNVSLGLSFPIFAVDLSGLPSNGVNGLPFGFTLRPDFGVAVTRSRNVYLVIAPAFTLGSSYSLMFPVGVHVDIPVVVRGLFLFFRATTGYGLSIDKTTSTTTTNGIPTTVEMTTVNHFGLVAPEAGLKYVLKTRINLTFTPVAVPIFFNSAAVAGGYQLLFTGGYNF